MLKLKFITLEQLLEMQANNEKFKLVEVLSLDYFKEGHLPRAINIPVSKEMTSLELTKIAVSKGIKKSDKVVVYCANYHCHVSTRATALFMKAGFKNTVDFKAGKQGWIDAGLELERS